MQVRADSDVGLQRTHPDGAAQSDRPEEVPVADRRTRGHGVRRRLDTDVRRLPAAGRAPVGSGHNVDSVPGHLQLVRVHLHPHFRPPRPAPGLPLRRPQPHRRHEIRQGIPIAFSCVIVSLSTLVIVDTRVGGRRVECGVGAFHFDRPLARLGTSTVRLKIKRPV